MAPSDRRQFLKATGASAIALLAGCRDSRVGHPVSEPVTAWSAFRGDRHNTGLARGVAPTSADPSIQWTFETDESVWASPVVVDGNVYVGSHDATFYAIDAASGDEQWRFESDDWIEGTAAVDGDTAYVGSFDQHLYALATDSGDPHWTRELGGLIRGSPTVVDGVVYVGVGCHNLACAEPATEAGLSPNGWLYALDAASGETEWRYDVGDEVVSSPAVVDGTIYVGGSDGTVSAIDAASGEDVWTYDAEDMVWSSPAVAFGTVYVGDWAGNVHAIDAATGREEWVTDTFGDYVSGSVAVGEDAVYVGHAPLNTLDDPNIYYGELFRFDRTDGEIDWSVETTGLEIGSSPVLTDDRVYVGTHRQTEGDGAGVHAITTDGEEEWFREVGEFGVGSSPALLDGTLYFGSVDGDIYAIE